MSRCHVQCLKAWVAELFSVQAGGRSIRPGKRFETERPFLIKERTNKALVIHHIAVNARKHSTRSSIAGLVTGSADASFSPPAPLHSTFTSHSPSPSVITATLTSPHTAHHASPHSQTQAAAVSLRLASRDVPTRQSPESPSPPTVACRFRHPVCQSSRIRYPRR